MPFALHLMIIAALSTTTLFAAAVARSSEQALLKKGGRVAAVFAGAGLLYAGWMFWAVWGLGIFTLCLLLAWVAGLFDGVF
ncbi:MAG: hypothetical protein ACU0DW_10935 [Shimia sp.]